MARVSSTWLEFSRTAATMACIAAGLSGCASGTFPAPQYLASPDQTAEHQDPTDPLETFNRSVLESNQSFNESVIYPISDAYRDAVPEPVRISIGNFTSNLNEPVVFANNVLQLRIKAAAMTTGRFLMNSTIGFGGLIDVASEQELPKQSGDFGQTLYVWGVQDSPYVVLPLLGPTNIRDAVGNGLELVATSLPVGGLVGSNFASSINGIGVANTALTPLTSLEKVGDLRELEKGSLDFYALLRSVVEQMRTAELEQAVAESGFYPQPSGGYGETASIPVARTVILEAAVADRGPGGEAELVGASSAQSSLARTGKIVIGPGTANASPAALPGGKIVIGAQPARNGGKIVIGASP